jgi:hypothetical protein
VFTDSDSKPVGEYYSQDVGDPELTPAGDKLVALRGANAETIRFYDTRSGRPVVSPCGLGEPVGGSAAEPTWAPDGSAVAWAEGDGIWSPRSAPWTPQTALGGSRTGSPPAPRSRIGDPPM